MMNRDDEFEPKQKDDLRPSVYAANTLMASYLFRKAYDANAQDPELLVAAARALDKAAMDSAPTGADRAMYHIAYKIWRDSGFSYSQLQRTLSDLGASL